MFAPLADFPQLVPVAKSWMMPEPRRLALLFVESSRLVIFGFRADGKARKESQEFPRSYLHSWVCEKCLAQKRHKDWEPRLNYQNFSDAAAYRMTVLSALTITFSA